MSKTAQAPSPERRGSLRYFPNPKMSCEVAATVADDLGPAHIRDVSAEGIAVILPRPVEPGTTLVLRLKSPTGSWSRVLLLRVAHVSEQAGGKFLVGGKLGNRLSPKELHTLLS